MHETITYYRTWIRDTRAGRWSLWCETRDPNDPYLIPTPDETAPVKYERMTTFCTPQSRVDAWQPSPELLAKGHPATWQDED